jgi:hypothetical protein
MVPILGQPPDFPFARWNMSKLDCTAWIAGSSPAMTIERLALRRHRQN